MKTKPKAPETTWKTTGADLDALIALAQRSQGWNLREYPPQRVTLASGCELIVMPPWLWRRRVGIERPVPACAPIAFRKRLILTMTKALPHQPPEKAQQDLFDQLQA